MVFVVVAVAVVVVSFVVYVTVMGEQVELCSIDYSQNSVVDYVVVVVAVAVSIDLFPHLLIVVHLKYQYNYFKIRTISFLTSRLFFIHLIV